MRAIVRRSLASVVLLLFTIALLELTSFVAYLLVEGERFSYAKFNDRRAEIFQQYEIFEAEGEEVCEEEGEIEDPVSEPAMIGSKPLEIPHPFLGYVRNPSAPRAQRPPFGPVNDYGWRGSGSPFHTDDDEAKIVIVGGSVAFKNWSSRDILIDRIKAPHGVSSLLDRILSYRTRPNTQLELPIVTSDGEAAGTRGPRTPWLRGKSPKSRA